MLSYDSGVAAKPKACKEHTRVRPQPNGKYTRAELASFDDSDSPPSLMSDEEAVTRMHYSDMSFGGTKPANKGTASGTLS